MYYPSYVIPDAYRDRNYFGSENEHKIATLVRGGAGYEDADPIELLAHGCKGTMTAAASVRAVRKSDGSTLCDVNGRPEWRMEPEGRGIDKQRLEMWLHVNSYHEEGN
jgi:hypothetical protein